MKKSFLRVFLRLLQLLLGSPSQGPAVDVTPPTTVAAILGFIAGSGAAAPVKSADSLCISKGIVPVVPTGTSGSRPSMEDTGMTYKTCACSRRS